MYFTRLFNRNGYDNWLAGGSKTFGENANNLLKEILQWHGVLQLDPKLEEEIKAITQDKTN